jgi:hypothetical protein
MPIAIQPDSVEFSEGSRRVLIRNKYNSRTMEAFSARFRVFDGEGQERSKSLKTKVAEAYGNRTHRAHLPVNPTGFEVQASHQARFTSAAPL